MTRNYNLQEELPTECRCVPESPFYVRWINRFGGIDYWLFSVHQSYSIKQTGQELFKPKLDDMPTRRGTTYAISKSLSSTVFIRAESLSVNEWQELSLIASSMVMQYYDESAEQWFDCVATKADNTMRTNDGLHAVELTIQLPDVQLHF